MPNRILRDWTDSEAVDNLSVHAERFFTRLIMKVDDFGRFSANPKILRGNLFILKTHDVREADITRWLTECNDAGLILLYETQSKQFLQIKNFNQRLRQKVEKYPPPSDDGHMTVNGQSIDGLKRREVETEVEEEENTGPPALKENSGQVKTEIQNTPPIAAGPHVLEKSNLFRKPNIPLFDDVHRVFIQQGGSKEMADKFYQKYEATGWYVSSSPIQNVGALISLYISNWRGNEKQNGSSKHQSKSERSTSAANDILADLLERNPGIST